MRYYFILLLLIFNATSHAQYDCGEELDFTDAPFGPYELTLIKANYPKDKLGIFRLQNRSEANIVVDGYFDAEEPVSDSTKNYYLHRLDIRLHNINFWRLKIKEPNKGWHYGFDKAPIGHGYFPSDELVIEPGSYVDLIGKIPHYKDEYLEDSYSEYKDYLYQADYQDYAYRIEYITNSGYFILSTPFCLRP